MKRIRLAILTGLCLAAATVLVAAPASAATYTVTNTNDAGAGSFRQAVLDANADPGSIVEFAPGLGPITLSSNVNITASMTIVGNGAGVTTLTGGDGIAVILIDDDGGALDVTITDLSVVGAIEDAVHADVFEEGLSLTLERVQFTDSGDDGLDVDADDVPVDLTVLDSEASGNGDDGIDLDGIGTATIVAAVERTTASGNDDNGISGTGEGIDYTISETTASGNGNDGLNLDEGAIAEVAASTFSGNDEDGVDAESGASADVVNSTMSGNVEDGLDGDDAGPLTALNSTIVGNGISGIDLVEAEATITNTIVYGNSTSDCTPGVTSGGGNIDGDDTCNLTAEADQPSTDPLLGPLADNGGPTLTHLPSAGSPAIDRALEGPCPPVDQRGLPRPVDGDGDGTSGCDVGSVEVQVDEPVEPVTPTTPPAGTDTTRVVEPRFTG